MIDAQKYPIAFKIHGEIEGLNTQTGILEKEPKPYDLIPGIHHAIKAQQTGGFAAPDPMTPSLYSKLLQEDIDDFLADAYSDASNMKLGIPKATWQKVQETLGQANSFALTLSHLGSDFVNHFTNNLIPLFERKLISWFIKENTEDPRELGELQNKHFFNHINRVCESMAGAYQNGIATILGLMNVVAQKLDRPDQNADASQWTEYTDRFFKTVRKNLALIRDIGSFHFDVQNLFHNLNGVDDRREYAMYPLDPENFEFKNKNQSEKGLTLSEKHIQEIIDSANNPRAQVIDNGEIKDFRRTMPMPGCPVLEMVTQRFGNFYSKFILMVTDLVEEATRPFFKQLILGDLQ